MIHVRHQIDLFHMAIVNNIVVDWERECVGVCVGGYVRVYDRACSHMCGCRSMRVNVCVIFFFFFFFFFFFYYTILFYM